MSGSKGPSTPGQSYERTWPAGRPLFLHKRETALIGRVTETGDSAEYHEDPLTPSAGYRTRGYTDTYLHEVPSGLHIAPHSYEPYEFHGQLNVGDSLHHHIRSLSSNDQHQTQFGVSQDQFDQLLSQYATGQGQCALQREYGQFHRAEQSIGFGGIANIEPLHPVGHAIAYEGHKELIALADYETLAYDDPYLFMQPVPSTVAYGLHNLDGQPITGDLGGSQFPDDQDQIQDEDFQNQLNQLLRQHAVVPDAYSQQGGHEQFHLTEQHVRPADLTSNVLQCIWSGCPLASGGPKEKTFRRRYELERHMKKHMPKEFSCFAVNCKKQFYRADKLKDHVQAGHSDDTSFACPVDGCVFMQMPLDRPIMRFHLGAFHDDCRAQYKHYFAALGSE